MAAGMLVSREKALYEAYGDCGSATTELACATSRGCSGKWPKLAAERMPRRKRYNFPGQETARRAWGQIINIGPEVHVDMKGGRSGTT